MVAYTFRFQHSEGRGGSEFVNSSPAWSTKQVLGQSDVEGGGMGWAEKEKERKNGNPGGSTAVAPACGMVVCPWESREGDQVRPGV